MASIQMWMVRECVTVVEMTGYYNGFTGNVDLSGANNTPFLVSIALNPAAYPTHYTLLGGVILGPEDPATGLPAYKRSFDQRTEYARLRTHLDPVVARFSGAEYWETWHPVDVVDVGLGVTTADHEWNFNAVTGQTFDKTGGERLYCTVLSFVPYPPL